MINRLEGYTGDGFNQRRAYIGTNNSINYLNDKKKLEEKVKKEEQLIKDKKNNELINRINNQNNSLKQMNNLMRNNLFK